MLFETVLLKPVLFKNIYIFRFFYFSVILLASHVAGCFPWLFLISCAMKAKYSISALLKPWLRSSKSISFAGPQEKFPRWQRKQGKISWQKEIKINTVCVGCFCLFVWFLAGEEKWVGLVCFGWFWRGGGCDKLKTIWGLSWLKWS